MSDTISPELREKIDLVVEKAIVRLIEKASKDQSLEALIKTLIVEKVMSKLKPLMNRYIAKKIARSEEHTYELQSPDQLVCRLLLEKKKNRKNVLELAMCIPTRIDLLNASINTLNCAMYIVHHLNSTNYGPIN